MTVDLSGRGALGTGAGVPPVDEQVIRLVLQTPALGQIELSESRNPKLFRLARVGQEWRLSSVPAAAFWFSCSVALRPVKCGSSKPMR